MLAGEPLDARGKRLLRVLARGVVGADQQITDDGLLRVPQRVTDTTAGNRLVSLRTQASS